MKISIWLIIIWNLYFFVALYAEIAWLSLLLLGVSLAATFYGSVQLCKHREDLIFVNNFAKEHAFPSTARNVRATFNMHLAAFLVFFLGPLLATSVVAIRPLAGEKLPLMYLGFLFGLPGVVGMTQHFVRKVIDRNSEQAIVKEMDYQTAGKVKPTLNCHRAVALHTGKMRFSLPTQGHLYQ